MGVTERLSQFLCVKPTLGNGIFIAPTAVVLGDVRLGDRSSIWYNAVLRADINYISIGYDTNIQDGVVGHLADNYPLVVGNKVTVGHGAVLHACTIEDECLIGMNCTILDGARIGKNSIIAAGSLVPRGTQVPEGSLFAGLPGKVKKSLSEKEQSSIAGWADKYLEVAKAHRAL